MLHPRSHHLALETSLALLALAGACMRPATTARTSESAPASADEVDAEPTPDPGAARADDADETETIAAVEVDASSAADVDETIAAAERVVSMLGEIDAALAAEDTASAKKKVDAALAEIDELLVHRPSVEVTYEVLRGNVLEAEQDVATLDLVPFVDEIEEDPQYVGTDGAAVDPTKKGSLEVLDSRLVHTEADLPVAVTRVRLLTAKRALEDGDVATARHEIGEALDDASVVVASRDAPIVVARRALWAAEREFIADQPERAREDIARAKDALDLVLAASDTPPGIRQAATQVREEIAKIDETLKIPGKTLATAFGHIHHVISAAAQYEIARQALMAAHRQGEAELAAAKLRLDWAWVEGRFGFDSAAREQLASARKEVGQAKAKIPASLKPDLDQVDLELARLAKVGCDPANPKAAATFSAANAHLDAAVFAL